MSDQNVSACSSIPDSATLSVTKFYVAMAEVPFLRHDVEP